MRYRKEKPKRKRSSFPEIVKHCTSTETKKFSYSCLSNLSHFQLISSQFPFLPNIHDSEIVSFGERTASFRLDHPRQGSKGTVPPVKKTGCLSASIVISRFMPALHARWIPVHYCLSQRLLGIATVYATFVQI